ncbi:protein of unknown function [Methylorubrum extorquens]|uniref:Uncharacterized protein n=1 Tax=Methylorubrum extorquens TaxID=408 RepID=A0A2N9AWQ6_METEX|nr:protein of unknown function [Methylorubrum extorquens]
MSIVVSDPYVLQHVLPEHEVTTQAWRLISLLVAAGEDPSGLLEEEFVPIVLRQKLAELIGRAIDHDVLSMLLDAPYWYVSEEGDAHIVFTFDTQVKASAFRLCVL